MCVGIVQIAEVDELVRDVFEPMSEFACQKALIEPGPERRCHEITIRRLRGAPVTTKRRGSQERDPFATELET